MAENRTWRRKLGRSQLQISQSRYLGGREVFRRVVFWSVRYSDRIFHLFLNLGTTGALGSIGPVFRRSVCGRRVKQAASALIFKFMASWRPGGLSVPRFPGSGISVGAVFWPHRPPIFNFGKPDAMGFIGPRFPEIGIAVCAVFWPRRPLNLQFRAS